MLLMETTQNTGAKTKLTKSSSLSSSLCAEPSQASQQNELRASKCQAVLTPSLVMQIPIEMKSNITEDVLYHDNFDILRVLYCSF